MSTTLRATHVIRFSPSGAADTLDITDTLPGACTALTNLIPDPTTKNIWTPYPVIQKIVDFSGLSNPGEGACFIVVGNYIYGLIASSLNTGKDQPYCYSINPSTFATTIVAVANVTSANSPASQGNAPAIVATMIVVGTEIWVTHQGFNSGGGYFVGWFDISIPGQPVWRSGNLNQAGGITAFGTITGGSGYDSGGTAVFVGVPLTGGTGSTATATVFVTSGVVTRVVINFPGTGYIVSDSLSASNANLGGSGTGFAVVVAAVQLNGAIQLTTKPAWVAQFYERAWLGVNPTNGQPSVIFTDVLGTGCSNANQALTFNDNTATTGAAGLGLNNQLGGIIQSLIIFKGDSYIVQITGDAALTGGLAQNSLNVPTGTVAPRSIVGTPNGLAFVAPDGARVINFSATVENPIGAAGAGITFPFTYANLSFPQSTAAGCNRGVLRFSVYVNPPGGSAGGQEWWYDINLKTWSGPHTVGASVQQYQPYQDLFIFQNVTSINGSPPPTYLVAPLYLSATYPAASAGQDLLTNWTLQTALYPNDQQMSQLELTEMQIMMSAPSNITTFVVNILDQDANVIATSTFTPAPGTTPTTRNLYPRKITFSAPVVVTRFAIQVVVTAGGGPLTRIGDIYIRVRDLGYLQELPG